MDEPKLYRYAWPNQDHEGWAVFLLDSYGLLTVASDFGDYVYHWPRQGWGEGDFRRFLLSCDDGYLISKLGQGRSTFDSGRSEKLIKEHILYYRRQGEYTKEFARQEWERLHWLDLDNEMDRAEWYNTTQLDDAAEMMCYGPEPRLVAFMKRVWPRFRKELEAALEREGGR